MPERNPTAVPTIIAGTTILSGDPNTGQVPYTFGGSRVYHNYSGTAGGDVNIHAGGGRLDSILIHPPATAATGPVASGLNVALYDSAVAVSGGPLSTSGHKAWKFHPADPALFDDLVWNSGIGLTGKFVSVGHVFTSGLCLARASGHQGITISYTPVSSG